jgi:hypothetical protein
MSRLHAFVQKRQLLIVLVAVFLCSLGGCALDQRAQRNRPITRACDQQCGAALDERTFVCIDRCHQEEDRTSLP